MEEEEEEEEEEEGAGFGGESSSSSVVEAELGSVKGGGWVLLSEGGSNNECGVLDVGKYACVVAAGNESFSLIGWGLWTSSALAAPSSLPSIRAFPVPSSAVFRSEPLRFRTFLCCIADAMAPPATARGLLG